MIFNDTFAFLRKTIGYTLAISHVRSAIGWVCLSMLLLGCETNPSPGSTTAIVRSAKAIANSPESLRSYLSDTSTKGYSKQHGTQMGYFSPDGWHYLVYPGNSRVLRSRWSIREGSIFGLEICSRYDLATYNPATRDELDAGELECLSASLLLQGWQEVRDGDPMKLRNTNVLPQILPKGLNLSMPTAAKVVGYSTQMSPNKAVDPDLSADARIGK